MAKTDLDEYDFSSFAGLNGRLVEWRYQGLAKYFRGEHCLELGSSDGQGTEYLAKAFWKVVAVDGSHKAVEELRRNFGGRNVTVMEAYFEDLALDARFDTIMMAHILEHVDSPAAVIEVAKRHLAPGGVMIADVPNALSIHRQVGVALGMIEKVTDLNDADRSIGHQRVYTPERFRHEFEQAGLTIYEFGGFMIKSLSNGQMEQWFDEPLTKALFDIGTKYPEIAAEMYIVAGLS